MATDKEIQIYVKEKYKTSIKTCWISDMKEFHGLKKGVEPNRISMDSKTNSCPKEKMDMKTDTFKHF